MSAFEELSFSIEADVKCSDDSETLGNPSLEGYSNLGWRWDRRIVEDTTISSTFYDEYLGGHTVGLKDGIKASWWQSGGDTGLEYSGLARYRVGDDFTWTPIFSIGSYSVYYEDRTLYSDYSYTTKFNIDDIQNGVNTAVLRDDCVQSSIKVALFERDSDFLNRFKYSFSFVDSFTGRLEDGSIVRLPTEAGENILWNNLCERANEYRIIGDTIYLNNNYSLVVGGFNGTITQSILEDLYEDSGYGYSHGRDIYTRYFPLQDGSIRLFVVDSSVEEYTQVANLNFSGSGDKHYSVDEDLGIITLGGYQAPNLSLAEAMDEDDTEVVVFLSEDISAYPPQGIVVIDGEQILYYEKGQKGFYNCVRGYNGTAAIAHPKYSIVSDIQHGKGISATQKIYIGYTAVPRIEYEVTGYKYRSACPAYSPLDVRPIRRVDHSGVIQISSSSPHLAEVVLSVDRELISSDLYGPVYFGTDSARLTATAYDSFSNPVEGIELTIVQESGPGSLNGIGSSYTALSNPSGQIFTLYNSPYSWDEICRTVNSVTHLDGNTILGIPEIPSGLTPSDITLYQVLKHDPTVGTQGEKTEVSDSDNVGSLDDGTVVGFAFIDIENVYRDANSRFKDGAAYILCTDGITYYRGIVHILDLYNPQGELSGHRLFLGSTVAGFTTGMAVRAWLMTANAEEFSTNPLNGTLVVMYEWNAAVQHPITGALGAFAPLSPSALTQTSLTYSNRLLSQPEPSEFTSNLGAYVFVAPALASFYAYGRDPISGRIIRSNNVRLRIDLPSFLKGVDYSGALPIPYGFAFISEEHNVGTGLGGANFLTINPKADAVSFFTLNANFG